MNLTLNLHYLTQQLKFVFLFVIWSYCFLRISHNTLSTAWVSLTEGFFHPDGLTKWWFYITMMPGWWLTHFIIILFIPIALYKNIQPAYYKSNYKKANFIFWLILVPILVIFF